MYRYVKSRVLDVIPRWPSSNQRKLFTQLNSTKPNSTELNSTELNLTELNSTELNRTQLGTASSVNAQSSKHARPPASPARNTGLELICPFYSVSDQEEEQKGCKRRRRTMRREGGSGRCAPIGKNLRRLAVPQLLLPLLLL